MGFAEIFWCWEWLPMEMVNPYFDNGNGKTGNGNVIGNHWKWKIIKHIVSIGLHVKNNMENFR